MMASTVVSAWGSPVARLTISAADAHPSSFGVDSQFTSTCALRSPGRLASPSSAFAGGNRICVESPRMVSPRRDGGNLCQAYARTTTCGETEEKEKVANPSSHSGIRRESTLYDILGVTEDAGVMDIKSAFRQLARRFHPDVNAEEQRDECTRDFMKIHAAYTTLSNPQSKAAYDIQLSMQRFQRSGYAGGRMTILTQNWDSSTTTAASASPEQSWNVSTPTGFSSPSGYSGPSSFNTEWKGRRWETDQCW